MARKTGSLAEEVTRLLGRCTRVGDCLMVPKGRYGEIRYDRGKRMSAHRAVYTARIGPIPPGLLVRHACDRPGCVEVSHLSVGTVADNSRDMVERGRSLSGMRHHRAKLAPEVVAAAVAEYLSGGASQAEVARRFGVGPSSVGRWVRAESRKDSGVPGVSVGRGSRLATGLIPCGNRAGVWRHRKNGEEPCQACREADRAYMRAYKAARRAA